MRKRNVASKLRALALNAVQAAALVEVGGLIYWSITHHSHGFFWSHYGWTATIIVMVVMQSVDLLVDDTVKGQYLFDEPAEEPDFEAEVLEFARRVEAGD